MPVFKKSVLLTGHTYHSPDGSVRVTKKRLKHWADMHQRLLANGNTVPIDWDHSDDPTKAVPMSTVEFKRKRRSAKNTVGHLKEFNLAPDGRSAELVMDLHRKSAVDAAEANSVFVSPVIFDNWKDGGNHDYEDLVTHVDFVNHPVDYSQGEFEPCPEGMVDCGIRMGLQEKKPSTYFILAHGGKGKHTYMGEEDEEDEEDEYDMGGDDDVSVDVDVDVDDDDDDYVDDMDMGGGDDIDMGGDEGGIDDDYVDDMDMGGDEDDDYIEEDVEEEDVTMLDYDSENGLDGDGDADFAVKILADLEGAGIAAPEGSDPMTDTKGFLAQLCAALKQKRMSESAADMDSASDGDEYDDDILDDDEVETMTPDIAALSLRADSAEQKLARVTASLQSGHRRTLIKRLSVAMKRGQITPKEHRGQLATCKRMRMAMGNSGAPKASSVSRFLASRECMPVGCALPYGQRLALVDSGEVQMPTYDENGHMTESEATALVDEQAKRMPGMYRPKKT